MRLYNMYFICKDTIEDIESLEIVEYSNGSNNLYYRIENWMDFVKILEKIGKIPSLLEAVNNVYTCIPTFTRDNTSIEISTLSKNEFVKAMKTLKDKMYGIVDLYDSLGYQKNTGGFDVKLPSFENLDELSAYIKEINFVVTQCPFLKNKDEEIRLNCLDVGSTWISFMILAGGTTVILANLAKIVDYAVKIKSHIVNVEQQEEQLRSMELKNDVISAVIDGYKGMNRNFIDDCIKELEDEIAPLANGEERGKAEKSLEKLAWLFSKGLEIHSSIDTKDVVKDLFLTNNDIQKIDLKDTKFIEDKNK